MDQQIWTEVDEYLAGRMAPSDPVLDAALESAAAAGMPAISVSPMQGRMLQLLAMSMRARAILEIGTLAGYSTICLARGMPLGGRLITLEKEPLHANVARASIARAGFSDIVDVRVGSALDSLPAIAAARNGPFDLIFIDADKQNIPAYFEWSLKLSHSGTMVIVDNVIRGGDVMNPDTDDPPTRGVREFFDMLSDCAGVTATAVQTVGVKGYDGFSMIVVAEPTSY